MFFDATALAIRTSAFTLVAWDILDNIGLEYLALRRSPFGLPAVAYGISRVSTITYLAIPLATFVVEATPNGCFCFQVLDGVASCVAQSATMFLFFLRLRGIYGRKGLVVWSLLILWGLLVVLPSILPLTLTILAGPTSRPPRAPHPNSVVASCYSYAQPISYSTLVSPVTVISLYGPSSGLVLFDTAIFFAIGYRLITIMDYSNGGTPSRKVSFMARLRSMFKRQGVAGPTRLAQGLLHDGQKYYLASVVVGAINILLATPLAINYGYAATPWFAITHVYACRVFRHTKLGIFIENSVATPSMSQVQAQAVRERRREAVTIAFAQDQTTVDISGAQGNNRATSI